MQPNQSEIDRIREERLANSLDAIAEAEALKSNSVLMAALERMESDAVQLLRTVDERDQFAMVSAVVGWRKSCAIRQVIDDLCDSRETVLAEIESLNNELNKQEL